MILKKKGEKNDNCLPNLKKYQNWNVFLLIIIYLRKLNEPVEAINVARMRKAENRIESNRIEMKFVRQNVSRRRRGLPVCRSAGVSTGRPVLAFSSGGLDLGRFGRRRLGYLGLGSFRLLINFLLLLRLFRFFFSLAAR